MSSGKDQIKDNDENMQEIDSEKTSASIVEAENTVNGAEKQEKKQKLTSTSKEKNDEKIIEERIYTVTLGRAWISPRKKTTPKSIRIIKDFVTRHMKVDSSSIKITNEVNEIIWSRGIEKPPRKIRIRVAKNVDGIVTVYPA